MSETPPLTEGDFEPLLQALTQANERMTAGLMATSHQAVAGMLVNALLIRELQRAGVLDAKALRAEALRRAEPLGPGVAAIIEGVFGGEAPRLADVPRSPALTVIPGGLDKP